MTSFFEQLPPAMVPVVVAVVASVIGALLWRIFKMALQIVAFIVFLIVCVGMLAYWQPELFGMGKRAVEEQLGSSLPDVDSVKADAQGRVKKHVDDTAKDVVETHKKSFFPTVPTEPPP